MREPVNTRLKRLEEAARKKPENDSFPIFCDEQPDGNWTLKRADTGKTKTVTPEQMKLRPKDRVYLMIAADGDIWLEVGDGS